MSRSFFPSYAAYRTWIQSMPHIQACRHDDSPPTLSHLPCEPLLPDLRGPYYLDGTWLALRVGAEFRVLQRVASQQEADFRWYAPAHTPSEDGYVYAAYIYAHQQRLVGATLQEVREALRQFLRVPRVTRRL